MKMLNLAKNLLVGVLACSPCASLNKYCTNLQPKMLLKVIPQKMKVPKCVIVFDDFSNKCIDVNNDSIYDATHGEFVSQIIKSFLPNSSVKKVDVMVFSDDAAKLRKHNKIGEFINSKIKYDAANISVGYSMSLGELSERTGIKLTRDNIASKVKEIKSFFRKNPDKHLTSCAGLDIKMGDINEFYKGMDSLSAKGTKIYVSASNDGGYYLNLASLIDNAQVIGRTNPVGISQYNSLVSRYGDDAVRISKVNGGYSLNGGKTKAFDDKQVSVYSKDPYPNAYHGTSFSAPKILALDLK